MTQLDWEAKVARFNSLHISPTTSLPSIKPKNQSFSAKTRDCSSVQVPLFVRLECSIVLNHKIEGSTARHQFVLLIISFTSLKRSKHWHITGKKIKSQLRSDKELFFQPSDIFIDHTVKSDKTKDKTVQFLTKFSCCDNLLAKLTKLFTRDRRHQVVLLHVFIYID